MEDHLIHIAGPIYFYHGASPIDEDKQVAVVRWLVFGEDG